MLAKKSWLVETAGTRADLVAACAFDDGRESGPLRCIGRNRAAVSILIGPILNPKKKSVCSIGGSLNQTSGQGVPFNLKPVTRL